MKEVKIIPENLKHNMSLMKARAGVEIFPVVKANAYGHGIENVVEVIEEIADGFCVATCEEGIRVRKLTRKPVLVFCPTDMKGCSIHDLTPVISSVEHLEMVISSKVKFFIKVDTGMGRMGFVPGDLKKLRKNLATLKDMIAGLISHFAYSDLVDTEFVREQAGRFEEIRRWLEGILGRKILASLCNSAGVLLLDEKFDIVRPGIAVYGVSPIKGMDFGLKPAMEVKSRLVNVKWIPKGHSVGYSRTFIAPKDMLLGIVGAGYADGFLRSLSNKAKVIVRGKKVRVIGLVSMDLTAVDLTGVDARIGDEVVLMGEQEGERITCWEIAELVGTNPYEILCLLGCSS